MEVRRMSIPEQIAYYANEMTRKNNMMLLFKFGIVGVSGIAVNTLILFILTSTTPMHYLAAAAIATQAAIIWNFFGNNIFTFKDEKTEKTLGHKFILFQTVSLAALALTVFLLWALTTIFGIQYLLILNVIAIGISSIANFMLNRTITWKGN
jgi:dolichol-phosphate mannosyltransferase